MVIRMKEVIVVEGKNDYNAVKNALPDAEIIITSGFGLNKEVMDRIKLAQKKRGVIIFTDPDHMGEIIRKKIQHEVPGVKHCYISRSAALANGDIGIENASCADILSALNQIRATTLIESKTREYMMDDLLKNNLIQGPEAKKRREVLGGILGIGYANGKTLLRRLNTYAITREEFENALNKMGEL